MAHLDVVPIDEGAPWQHPPFGAEIHDGSIWGRGTLDDKGCVVAICEAVELLLEAGETPAQDVWLSFGCDEEVSGTAAHGGRGRAAATRRHPVVRARRGRRDRPPGLPRRRAAARRHRRHREGHDQRRAGRRGTRRPRVARRRGTARPRASRRRSCGSRRAPSPRPPRRRPSSCCGGWRRTSRCPLRPIATNAERITPLVTKALLAAGPEAAAMTRTTVAATTLSGSPALNVIASSARAGLNIRIMVGDTVAGVLDHLRRAIRDDDIRDRGRRAGRAVTDLPDGRRLRAARGHHQVRVSPTRCPRPTS